MSIQKTRDRTGQEIARGDVVEVVHFGEHHRLTIEEIVPGQGDLVHLAGTIRIEVPAGAVHRCPRPSTATFAEKSGDRSATKREK